MQPTFSHHFDVWVARVAVGLILAAGLTVAGVYYYAVPAYTRVGYQPEQPIAFSHKLHAGNLGMSCLYCHSHVEQSPHSNVPSTQTCMNCHLQNVKINSPLLAEARESWKSGDPIEWIRIHKVPEYAYFNHAVHINRGVSCVSCHGKVNEMTVVWHDQPLSMGWCLQCHRNPEDYVRPREQVVNLDWTPPEGTTQQEIGEELVQIAKINPPQTCGGCHR